MEKISKGSSNPLYLKVFSPLYLAIMLVATIIVGNIFSWSDATYGTHLNTFNPLLVILTIVLFALYIYRIVKRA